MGTEIASAMRHLQASFHSSSNDCWLYQQCGSCSLIGSIRGRVCQGLRMLKVSQTDHQCMSTTAKAEPLISAGPCLMTAGLHGVLPAVTYVCLYLSTASVLISCCGVHVLDSSHQVLIVVCLRHLNMYVLLEWFQTANTIDIMA